MSEKSTKEKLLYAALDLFSKKGYDATGVDEIAESIGLSGPIIYKYFKGKEDLLNSIHTIYDAPYNEQMGFGSPFLWIHNGAELKQFSLHQITYTIKDETTIKLRKLCTIEQFRNKELTFQATNHTFDRIINLYTDIFAGMIEYGAIDENADPKLLAIEYTGATAMLIQLSDRVPSRQQEALDMIEKLIDFFIKTHCKK